MRESRIARGPRSGASPFVAPQRAPAPDPSGNGPGSPAAIGEEARARGFAAGLEQGRETSRAESEALFGRLAAAIRNLALERATFVRAHEADILLLATRIATKVVGECASADPEIARRALAAALEELPSDEPLRVRCHPADAAALAAGTGSPARDGAGDEPRIRLIEDPAIPRGGCVVDSAAGELDLRLETRLLLIERALLERC